MMAADSFNYVRADWAAVSLSLEVEIDPACTVDAEVGVIPRKSAFTVRGPRVW